MLRRLAIAGLIALAFSPAAQAQSTSQAPQDPSVQDVFVIALENHNWTQPSSYTSLNQLYGDPAAPFLNSLVTPGNANAAQSSFASNYHNVVDSSGVSVHPSEPNYVWAEAGVHGPLNDNTPYPSNIVNAQSLSALLGGAGVSWRSYQEDIDLALNGSGQVTSNVVPLSQWTVPLNNLSGTSPAYTNPYNGSNQYDYAAKHNPQVFFTATNGGTATTPDTSPSNPQAKNYAPLQQLATDLANNTVARYNWITPDQFNDMHTTLTNGFTYNGVTYTGDQARIAQGDNFLAQIIPLIMNSQAYKNNGAILIWNDETEGETSTTADQFTSTEILLSPLARGNAFDSSLAYDHSSDLKTMQEIFGVTGSPLGGAAAATDLAALFQPGVIPSASAAVPEPATWLLMLVGFGLVGFAIRGRRERPQVRFAF